MQHKTQKITVSIGDQNEKAALLSPRNISMDPSEYEVLLSAAAILNQHVSTTMERIENQLKDILGDTVTDDERACIETLREGIKTISSLSQSMLDDDDSSVEIQA